MTKITISNKEITVSGHSGHNVLGKDIVCSSISTMCNYLQTLDDLDYEITEQGYKFGMKKATESNVRTFTNLILQLQAQYKEHVSVEIIIE